MTFPTFEVIKKLVGTDVQNPKSPAGNWLQPRLESFEKGEADISIIVRPEMCNPYQKIHGGMMSLLVDESIGWAIISLSTTTRYTSVTLNLDFLYAANEGERITAKTRIIRHGKKIINAAVEVYNENNILLCRANSNLIATSMPFKVKSD